ncbi:flagellar biosynthetic protein FliO [Paraliomyxa miuraensis]|uniref:flagellar biosynthetic protein FliO n=1 Tax=Paraliomyxa miuraensis TaxID=376150 RepID=UPI002250D734|nr:flagellar biosynthetic protein FliO [Paraliomyxa miuraensis]MCX4241304.1 flagellar biosynthetic protein FliO [Paraliomyxa miuraensis]
MLVALAGATSLTVLGLLLGAGALLGLWAQARGRSGMGVHRHTVALGSGQALHVVELEGRRLVIGTGPGAAPRLLTELTTGSKDAATEAEAGR